MQDVRKYTCYKFLWQGDVSGLGSVGILIAECWTTSAMSINRIHALKP